jgi:hypothetical protein
LGVAGKRNGLGHERARERLADAITASPAKA